LQTSLAQRGNKYLIAGLKEAINSSLNTLTKPIRRMFLSHPGHVDHNDISLLLLGTFIMLYCCKLTTGKRFHLLCIAMVRCPLRADRGHAVVCVCLGLWVFLWYFSHIRQGPAVEMKPVIIRIFPSCP